MSEGPDDLVELTTRPNEMDAALIRQVLSDAGIQSATRVANSAALGIFGASSFNSITVMVRRRDVDRANASLRQNRTDSVDIDWNEVDLGEPQDEIARRLTHAPDEPPHAGRRVRLAMSAPEGAVVVAVLSVVFVLMGMRIGWGFGTWIVIDLLVAYLFVRTVALYVRRRL